MAKAGPRKKLPKELAVINADNCTGCEACLEVCPVDCIFKVQQFPGMPNMQSWCPSESARRPEKDPSVRVENSSDARDSTGP